MIFDGSKRKNSFLKHLSHFKNLFIFEVRANHNDFGDYIRKISTRIALKNNFKAITFLDADNYIEQNHFSNILNVHIELKKNIIITSRKVLDQNDKLLNSHDNLFFNQKRINEIKYFDTNMITLFSEKIKFGQLWGKYPREMSLIGDRIISRFLINNFKNDIAFNNAKSIIYYQNKISKIKIDEFKVWYSQNYDLVKDNFFKNFGFHLEI